MSPPPATKEKTGGVVLAAQKEHTKVLVGVRKIGASEEQNQWVQYAFERCGLDCVITWEGEGGWILLRPGNERNKVGKLKGTLDMGLCQMNWQFHFDFIFDIQQSDFLKKLSPTQIEMYRRSWNFDDRTMYNTLQKELNALYSKKAFTAAFQNPTEQLNRCVSIWNDAKKKGTLRTTFYAWNNIKADPAAKKNLLKLFEFMYQ